MVEPGKVPLFIIEGTRFPVKDGDVSDVIKRLFL